jgi:cephalosporin hydroxylase
MNGHFIYKNLIISQHPNVGEKFKTLIDEYKPSRVLEIGTADGGLTLLIRDLLDSVGLTNTIVRTYDVNEQKNLKLKERNIEIITKDVFNYPYSDLEYPDEIRDFIQSNGKTLVLCDGGSKKNEFRLLSQFLKYGDIIMAHDYAPNENYFNENIKDKIWNWLEIQDSDINESCLTYNLKPYMEDEFRSVVWACKIKKQ